MIPEDYVPDLDLRMGLYRRLNELEDSAEIEGFAAEMIDRFGPLPDATENLLKLIEIKLNAARRMHRQARRRRRRARWSHFHDDGFPDLAGPDRLCRAARRARPGCGPTASWSSRANGPTPAARLNGALQLSRGLAKILTAERAERRSLSGRTSRCRFVERLGRLPQPEGV